MIYENRINSDRKYTMYQAFGDPLFSLDKRKNVQDPLLAIWNSVVAYRCEAPFENGTISMDIDVIPFSVDSLNKDYRDAPVYFPTKKPAFYDIGGIHHIEKKNETEKDVRTLIGFAELAFFVDGIPTGNIRKGHYKYRFVLEGPNGKFVSNASSLHSIDDIPRNAPPEAREFFALLNEDWIANEKKYGQTVSFHSWRPSNGGKPGLLCVPTEYSSVAPLEIMLETRTKR